jgi:carboxylesterase type B
MASITALWLIASAAAFAVDLDVRGPIQIETGLVEGISDRENDVVIFKGIPYAAPPLGNLRWREPQPPARWQGIRGAANFGASCTQIKSPSGKQPADMSEDCLFLNVWTPARSAADKLPVLFFIHGGAWSFGSGNIRGEGLAKKGLIVVTANYRLGIFCGMGHPELTAESPHHACGNYGMLDLIAALKWVRKNIAAFGGDPSRVTIAGHSSGANAVHYLLTSPVAKGLFRGAIGVSFPYDYLTKPHAIGNAWQHEQEGLKFAAAKKAATLEALRRIPARDLIASDPAVGDFTRACLGGGVNTDGWAFPLEYPQALDQGLESDVPTLTGLTADDFGPPAKYLKVTATSFAASLPPMFGEKRNAFLAARDAFLALCPVTTDQEAREMAKRAQIEYRMASVYHWAKRRAKTAKTPVYTYFFEQAIPSQRGAYHGSDLPYEFNNLDDVDRPWTQDDRRVADQVSSYWVHFVASGNPNGGNLPEWAPFTAEKPCTMALGTPSGRRPIAKKERLGFYRDLLEE